MGWNAEGQEPDTEPHEFLTLRDAQVFLRDELMWLARDEPDHSVSNEIYRAAQQIERSPFTRDWKLTFGGKVYWMSPEPAQVTDHSSSIGFILP